MEKRLTFTGGEQESVCPACSMTKHQKKGRLSAGRTRLTASREIVIVEKFTRQKGKARA